MKKHLRPLLDRIAGGFLRSGLLQRGIYLPELTGPDKASQVQLLLRYRELAERGAPLPALDDVGFTTFSQTDEDGILLYLLALTGMGGRRGIELGCGDGLECNLANLAVHHSWNCLMVDGHADRVRLANEFYRRRTNTWMFPPTIVERWLTAENVNDVVREHGFEGEADVLSIDLDGIDYWLWKALECVRPRVVVVEYNNMWGPDDAVAIPYSSEQRIENTDPEYYGASLAAYVKLGREKGYRFAGCNGYGFNAFFIRDDQAPGLLPEGSVEKCLQRPWAVQRRRDCLPRVRRMAWVEV